MWYVPAANIVEGLQNPETDVQSGTGGTER